LVFRTEEGRGGEGEEGGGRKREREGKKNACTKGDLQGVGGCGVGDILYFPIQTLEQKGKETRNNKGVIL
jgi:hypothetical protein